MMRCEIYNLTHQSCNFTASVIPLKSASPDVQGLSLPCTGTVSFSLLSCALLSTFYLGFFFLIIIIFEAQLQAEQKASCHSPPQIPKAFCDLLPNNLDTHTVPKWKALGETIPGLISGLEMCLARERKWMGRRRQRPHVAIYFKIFKQLATLSFCNILYQQLFLNNTTSCV